MLPLSLPPAPALYVLSVSVPLLVFSETKSSLAGHTFFKILSSIAFISGPLLLVSINPSSPHSLLITSGLLLSLIGDVCLIPSRKDYYRSNSAKQNGEISTSFQLGIVAFAAAHIAYILAFFQNNAQEDLPWTTFTSTFVATMLLARWLGVIYPTPSKGPSSSSLAAWTSSNVLDLSVPEDLRLLVFVYAIIISSMLAVAASTTTPFLAASPELPPTCWLKHQHLIGAAMFVISDVFVAKDAFGKKSREGKHWLQTATGFGLYFWGQMMLAGTVEGKC